MTIIFYVNVDHYNRFRYFAYNFFLKSTQSHYWCKIKLTRGEEYYVQVCTRPQTRRNPTSTHAQLLKYSKLFNITLTSSSHIVAWIRNASDFISRCPAFVLWYKYDYKATMKIFRITECHRFVLKNAVQNADWYTVEMIILGTKMIFSIVAFESPSCV